MSFVEPRSERAAGGRLNEQIKGWYHRSLMRRAKLYLLEVHPPTAYKRFVCGVILVDLAASVPWQIRCRDHWQDAGVKRGHVEVLKGLESSLRTWFQELGPRAAMAMILDSWSNAVRLVDLDIYGPTDADFATLYRLFVRPVARRRRVRRVIRSS